MYASDYPHGESHFPKSVETVLAWDMPRASASASSSGTTPCASTRAVASTSNPKRSACASCSRARIACSRCCIRRPRRSRASWSRRAARPASSAPPPWSAAITGLADVGTATMSECVQIGKWIAGRRRFSGDPRRRHRPRRHHGGAAPGARMHRRRPRRRAHRRPADRRQAPHAIGRRAGRAARAGHRALSRGGRHAQRARPVVRDHGAVLRARRDERRPRRVHRAPARVRARRRRRLGAVRVAALEDEIRRARAAVKGMLSFMRGKLPRYLSAEEHLALGVNVAWYPGFTHHVIWAALWDFMRDFQKRGIHGLGGLPGRARPRRRIPIPDVPPGGRGRREAARARAALLQGQRVGRRPREGGDPV